MAAAKTKTDDDLSCAIADAVRFCNLGSDVEYSQQLAAMLRRAYEQGTSNLAMRVGASLARRAATGPDPARVLGDVAGAVQRHFGGHGSSTRLASLLQDLCVGYVGTLSDRPKAESAKSLDNSRIGIGDKRRAAHARDQQVAQYFLPAAMRTALDRGEFFAVYQPIFRLADTTIIGAEALLRWAHPKLGTLLPGRFIEIAENNGLITSLTAFVIEEACRVARDWRDDSSEPQPFVSVNIASSVICDPKFIPLVKNALTGNGLPASALQLELGHDTSLGKDAAALIALQELSALGVGIAIDDFGTGFSSFANLPNLPVGVVKLAGKLVENIGGSIRDRAADEQITRAMIQLGRGLGLTVTAKHVETPRQLDRLHAFGCNNAQGWHFAQPLPASSFLAG